MLVRVVLSIWVCLLAPGSALAVEPDEILRDPVLELRARTLSKTLRCMVCQNQSIDDSDAPLARDLRLLVRERIVAGDGDSQVRDFLALRYGEFVLLEPRRNGRTLLLWSIPLIILLLGLGILWRLFRTQPLVPAPPLTADEKRRLKALSSRDADLTKS